MSQNNSEPCRQEYQVGGWKAHWILIVCCLLYMINYMDRMVFSVVMQPMKLELGLSDQDLGLSVTVFILGMCFFSAPVAYLIDHWSRKKSIALMAIIWSIFTFITGLAKNFAGVLMPRSLVGIGEAGFAAGGTAMITAAYKKEKHGRTLGIFATMIPVGMALGTIIGGLISVKLGWRYAFFIFAVPGILLGIAALFLRDYKNQSFDETTIGLSGFFRSIGRLTKIPTLRWHYIGNGLFQIMLQAQIAWLPSILIRELAMKEDTAGLIMGIIGLTAIIGALLGGWVTDFLYKKFPRSRMLVPALATLIAAIMLISSLLVIKTDFMVFMVLVVIFGISSAAVGPPTFVMSQEIVPASYKGLSWGTSVFFMMILGGAWAPWVTGCISDAMGGGADGLKTAVILAGIAGLAGAFFWYMSSRTYSTDISRVKYMQLEPEK